jgi:hypothetical protein
MTAGCFVYVVTPFNGALENLGPGPLNRSRTKVDDRITAFDDFHYRIEVAEFTGHGLFMRLGCTDVSPIGKPYRCCQWRQTPTQLLAKVPRGAGD